MQPPYSYLWETPGENELLGKSLELCQALRAKQQENRTEITALKERSGVLRFYFVPPVSYRETLIRLTPFYNTNINDSALNVNEKTIKSKIVPANFSANGIIVPVFQPVAAAGPGLPLVPVLPLFRKERLHNCRNHSAMCYDNRIFS